MNTEAIAKRLVELCRAGKYEQAHEELYAEDAVSIEPEGLPPEALGSVKGLAAIREKGRRFNEQIEAIHDNRVSDPVIAGNWFSLVIELDATFRGMGRVRMREICVYGVRDGRIAHEQFFYDVG